VVRWPGAIVSGYSNFRQAFSCHITDAFTHAQRDFLTEWGEIRVALTGVTALGPIASKQWKDLSVGGVPDVAAELWTVAGLDFLELSIRVTAAARDAAKQQSAEEGPRIAVR
jgi:hypothetical protein